MASIVPLYQKNPQFLTQAELSTMAKWDESAQGVMVHYLS